MLVGQHSGHVAALHALPPGGLAGVHGGIGQAQQDAGLGAILRCKREADRGADVRKALASHLDRFANLVEHLATDNEGRRLGMNSESEDHELVPAHAGCNIAFAHGGAQSPADMGQDFVPGLMTHPVVVGRVAGKGGAVSVARARLFPPPVSQAARRSPAAWKTR